MSSDIDKCLLRAKAPQLRTTGLYPCFGGCPYSDSLLRKDAEEIQLLRSCMVENVFIPPLYLTHSLIRMLG